MVSKIDLLSLVRHNKPKPRVELERDGHRELVRMIMDETGFLNQLSFNSRVTVDQVVQALLKNSLVNSLEEARQEAGYIVSNGYLKDRLGHSALFYRLTDRHNNESYLVKCYVFDGG